MAGDHIRHLEATTFEVLILDLELPEPELAELTPSERAVALLVADGLSNEAVARERKVSPRTVANQLRTVFAKVGVGSRWELSLFVARRSLEGPLRPSATRPRTPQGTTTK